MSLAAATSSSSNALIISSRPRRSAGPFRIQFAEDWRNNGIMEWHHSLGRRPTKINVFQLRREGSAFKHQYVVLILSDNCILRLDRRGDEANPVNTMKDEGTESVDTIADVESLSDLDKTSDCLAKLHCQGSNVDLLNIIKICFGIHRDNKAGRYTLQRFNCYFFAWTLLIATARHIVRWDMLPPDSSWETMSQTLADALLTKTADAMINLMIKGTVITAITTRLKLKSQLSRTMSRRARLTWATPEWLIRLAVRVMLRSSGKSGIHSSLLSRLRSEVQSTLRPTLNSVLTDLRASTLRTTLWKEDVGDAVRDAAYRDATTGILNAITAAVSGIKLTMEDVDAFRSLAGTSGDTLLGGFGAMMKAAPLFAAPEARAMVTDDTKWNELWNSLRDIVRNASKEAMKDEEGGWTELWAVAWETLRPEIRDACRITLKELTDLTKTLPDSYLHIDVRDTIRIHTWIGRYHAVRTAAIYAKTIRDHGRVVGRFHLGSPAKVEKDIREAMDRVWRVVADLDGGDANGSGDHNADVSQPPYTTER
ncbi:hypothetical protein BS47DRAFT_1378611 [Hydnum rufescens UP504]|uniref:Uncharacterized protein n=1 Tax=Hydnum rufescens UP504 TaxID=1448309 RepID=A0A9P6DZQ4_9AGAM|nr:hypothetical protein BS47DRAFT_1378611 [Hydnum rufescens UP504]